MADPITPVVLAGLGAVMATVGTVVTSVQQSNAAKANQSMANQQADIALQQSRIQQEQIQRRGALVLGQQTAGAGASGIDTGSGSLLDVQADTGTQIQYDSLKAKYNGDLQSWADRAQAAQFGQQADNALISGGISVGSSLLGGATKTYGAGVDSGLWPRF